MTLKDWLIRERRPEYSGINARASLRRCTTPNTTLIHQRINLRSVLVAIDRLSISLK